MRRNVYKQFVMNEVEAADLAKKAEGACMSEGRLIRMLIKGYVPQPAPDRQFHADMEQIRSFYDCIAQLAAGTCDPAMQQALAEEIRQWKAFRIDMQEKYLGREEKPDQWL